MRLYRMLNGVMCGAIFALLASGCIVKKTEETAPQSEDASTTGEATEAASAVTTPENITTPSGIEMVAVPAGTFTMGDADGEADEQPAHEVTLAAFYMDAREVKQSDFEALMGSNPSKYKNPDQPVEQLGWYMAIKYCNARSLKDGLTPCYDLDTMACNFDADGYRLPTEAEWEYACRAGTTSDYSFGENADGLDAAGWFDSNAGDQPKTVGGKQPNAWGLYDMHGNVAEWCNDVYGEGYYAESPAANPNNAGPGEERVLRGGSWNSPAELCRSSARYSEAPGLADVCFGYDAYGFRCVRRNPGDSASQ